MEDQEEVGRGQLRAVAGDQGVAATYGLEALRVQVVMRNHDAMLAQRAQARRQPAQPAPLSMIAPVGHTSTQAGRRPLVMR